MSVPTPPSANNQSTQDLSLASAIKGLSLAVGNMNHAIIRLESCLDAKAADDAISISTESSIVPSLESVPTVPNSPTTAARGVRMLLNSPMFIPRSVIEPTYDPPIQFPDGLPPLRSTVTAPTGITAPIATRAQSNNFDTWYVVSVGRQPGIFCGSDTIMANTHRIKHAKATPCSSEDEAKVLFNRDLDAGLMERVEYTDVKRTTITREMVPPGTYVVPN